MTRWFAVTLILFLISFSTSSLYGQDQENSENNLTNGLEYRAFRMALVPGLSTNGIDANQYASKYSMNILVGYNGALHEGYELGGLLNINKYYAQGVQVAGIGNYSGEETQGVQLAGVFNLSHDEMQGIQLSGAGNIAYGDMQGVQITGLLNWSEANSQGIQISSGANISGNDMQGLFFTGIGNISGGNMQGIASSGVINYTRNEMQGIMITGGVNYSELFQGIAMGTLNVSDEFQGIQAGAVNYTRYGQGIQFGAINYGRNFEGVPVGLISYYKDGRREMDLWTSDGGFTNIGLKLGTDEIYNMISIGYNPSLQNDVWQLGWSIGRLHEHNNYFHYTDFSYYKINEGDWTKDLNSILKYRILFGKDFGRGLQLYGGPTFNLMISKLDSSDQYTWYRLFDFGAKGRDYVFWIGYSFGVELF